MNDLSTPGAPSRDEQAALWCLRVAEASLSAAEQAAFDEWLFDDPQNAAAFDEAVAIWHGIQGMTATPEMLGHRVASVERLRTANARRWNDGSARAITTAGRIARRWSVLGAVAACILVALVGMLLYDPTATYRTGVGERRVVVLDDGTRLTLDGDSRVDVRYGRARRKLTLVAGRAKFDVAHDPLRPLSVLAGNRLTVATGTSFSVELLPHQMRVVLYDGRVEVLPQSLDAEHVIVPAAAEKSIVRLKAGRELIASTETANVRVEPVDMARSQSWENGLLTFADEPLALAVERVNRGAATPLVVDDRRIGAYRISGVFAVGDIQAFVEGISELYPIEAVRGRNAVILKRRETLPPAASQSV